MAIKVMVIIGGDDIAMNFMMGIMLKVIIIEVLFTVGGDDNNYYN